MATTHKQAAAQLPIVYRPEYNFQLQLDGTDFSDLNYFTKKSYQGIVDLLQSRGVLKDGWRQPEKVTESELSTVHPKDYLSKLLDASSVFNIFEIFLENLDEANGYQKKFIQYQTTIAEKIRLAQEFGTGGTLLAANLALEKGWAINLSGGYHHAHSNVGSGFCLLADGPIAIKRFLKAKPEARVLIIDLDAHFGDGNAKIFQNEKRVYIFDVYNKDNFPFKESLKVNDFIGDPRQRGKMFLHGMGAYGKTDEQKYLDVISQSLSRALDEVQPQLIYYNAGTDIYKNDPIGGLWISAEGIVARDEIVFREAKNRSIPIFMTLSGGYHADVPGIIANSIENLVSLMGTSESDPSAAYPQIKRRKIQKP